MTEFDKDTVPEYLRAHTNRLCQNLVRVDSLINLHEYCAKMIERVDDSPPEVNDILRSATVLLHASMEDFMRSIALAHLPKTDPDLLKNIPLVGLGNLRQTKFTLGDLIVHRQKEVEVVIKDSIDQWLHNQSFNNCNDVVAMLKHIGIDPGSCNESFSLLGEMITRRHSIVHNADRPVDSNGFDTPDVLPISSDTVQQWRETVQAFMQTVLYQLQSVVEPG